MLLPKSLRQRRASHKDRNAHRARQRPSQRPTWLRRLRVEPLEDRCLLAVVAVFDDPGFVDTGGTFADESDNIQGSLSALGHTVNTFTGTTATDFEAALSASEILVIPELANGDLSAALDAAAISEIADFVSGGGGVIVAGTGPVATGVTEATYDVDFLNTVFGFSITDGGDAAGAGSTRTGAAVGTEFASGPATLGANNGMGDLLPGSLPAGGLSIYEDSGETTVALIPFNQGQIVYLGWDWFNSDPPNTGGQDGGWQEVLDRAVTQVTPTDPVITGTNNADDFLLRRNASNPDLVELLIDGEVRHTWSRETLDSLTIFALDGDDALQVDFVNGDPVPTDDGLFFFGEGGSDTLLVTYDGGPIEEDSGPITFDGGSGTSDELTVQGDGRYHIVSEPSSTTAGEGTVTVGGRSTISYTGLEPVTISRSPRVTFITGGSEDDVEVDGPSPFVTRITGSSDGVPFETHTLYNVAELVLDARFNDTGGEDLIEIDQAVSFGVNGRVDESENNNSAGAADGLFFESPFGHGEINPIGDIDYWRTFGQAGDLIFAYVDTSLSSTGTDAVMQVLDDDQILVEVDDDDGPGLTPVVAGAFVPISGDVFFRINEFADNDTITPYRLYQTIVDPADSADEVEDNNSQATATPITATMMTGRATGTDVDYFSSFIPAGSEIVVMLDDDPDRDSTRSNLLIELLDSSGAVLESSTTQALVPVTAPTSDTYFVRISNLGGAEDDYRFVATLFDPQPHEPQPLFHIDTFSGAGADLFLVTPRIIIFQEEEGLDTITVNGDGPTTEPGDWLAVNLRGVTGAQVPVGGTTSGVITSESHETIFYSNIERLITTDRWESNDTIETATVLGSLNKITLNDLSIDTQDDEDFFQYTAQDTGKLIVNVHFDAPDLDGDEDNDLGDLDLRIFDSDGNLIDISASVTNDEQLVIPVVSQQQYFIAVDGFAGDVNNYDLEIENFAAPVPNAVVFDPTNDSGISNLDHVTFEDESTIFIEADLADFQAMGIDILTAAEATAGTTAGAAVEVFVNGNSVGFADPVPATNNDLFEFTFAPGDLEEGGNLVKGAVRIFDGQATTASGRTQLSEPLAILLDTVAPDPSDADLLAFSDTGMFDDDDVTSIVMPAFAGVAEANANIRVYANGELVGQGVVGTDNTDGEPDNGLGIWEVTVEPLDDGTYNITTEVEDLAGNISARNEGLTIWVDSTEPNTPYLDLIDDTGRNGSDDVTFDNTPQVTVTANDTPDGDGNPFPHEIKYRIYDRPGDAAGEVLLVDVTTFQTDGFFTHTLPALADGVHNLKLEVEDRAGNLSHDFLLVVVVDTEPPPVSIGDPGDPDDGLVPDGDTGVAPPNPDTETDLVSNDTSPTFWGRAEANAIVRLYADANGNGVLDVGTDVFLGQDTAIPIDGNNQEPDGFWQIESVVNLNDEDIFPLADGPRRIFVTAEDLAGNVNAVDGEADLLDVFIDTEGPVIDDVFITDAPAFDLFDPKPAQGPTPLVESLSIKFTDLPPRTAAFLFDALKADVALQPGHFRLAGDATGLVAIEDVTITQTIGPDPVRGLANVAMATIQLDFAAPLPDDRFTLTVSDSISDVAGNLLDGESNAAEPQETPLLPTGDGVPGGDFVARFTVDTRAEIGVWASGSVYVDTNGNYLFDPQGLDRDVTNRDITYILGFPTDRIFSGNFSPTAASVADGFDKLADFGRIGGSFRWLIDTDNDGVPNLVVTDPEAVVGFPVAGNFDGSAINGDEVGLKAGVDWHLDTDHDYRVDTIIFGDMIGLPIVGDFDGDGTDDLGSWVDDTFHLNLSTLGAIDGLTDISFRFGFAGVREQPVAADVDGDGIDDIGLWVPDRAGVVPEPQSEWYFIVSDDFDDEDDDEEGEEGASILDRIVPNREPGVGGSVVDFTPIPFGPDKFAQFGDVFAIPLVGNFDPPVTPRSGELPLLSFQNSANALDVNNDGLVSAIDVLRVINSINSEGSYSLPIIHAQGELSGPFLDVNGDYQVTPVDVLHIVNFLNRQSAGGEGLIAEGEPVVLHEGLPAEADAEPAVSMAAVASLQPLLLVIQAQHTDVVGETKSFVSVLPTSVPAADAASIDDLLLWYSQEDSQEEEFSQSVLDHQDDQQLDELLDVLAQDVDKLWALVA